MEAFLTKQKEILNGNEAFLLGVDKESNQIWIEVLNPLEIKSEIVSNENLDLNHLLSKKVFNITDGNYLSSLIKKYFILHKYMNHADPEAKQVMKTTINDILSVLKPTI